MFSPEDFIRLIDAGRIYYFASSKLSSNESHYFICISKVDHESLMAFVCCTTQFEKRAQFHEAAKYPGTCLVRIKNSVENGLTRECYVDCTKVFQFTMRDFKAKYENGTLEFKGSLEEIYFEQILIGIKDSPTTDPSMVALVTNMIGGLYS